jgi:hypothetical protein
MRNGETRIIGKATIVCTVHRKGCTVEHMGSKRHYTISRTTYDVIVDGKSVKGETILRTFAEAKALAEQQ